MSNSEVLFQNKISGKVTDENGLPVPSVNVAVKGTATSTETDMDGNYTINAKKGDRLVFTFIGMEETSVVVEGKSTINVVMKSSSQNLDQVVVTAFGIKRNVKSLGYAISKIEGKDLTIAGASTNPISTLYGKAAGVGVTTNAAGPTGAVDIKIRGAAGMESVANTRPLFVVDGMPIYDKGSNMASRDYDPLNSVDYGSGINDLNAEDIASMEILKGAKATVLYGGRGVNGVVLITTKKGSKSKGLGISYNTQYTNEIPRSYIDFQNEYGTGRSEYTKQYQILPGGGQGPRQVVWDRFNYGPKFDGSPVQFLDGSIRPYQAYPNNYMDLFRTGSNTLHTLAISGGGENGNMRVSYTNQDYQGLLPNSYQKKNVININGMLKASDFASVEVNSSLFKIKTHNRNPNLGDIVAWGINRDYDFKSLMGMYKNPDGSKFDPETAPVGWPGGQNAPTYLMNTLWEQLENSDTDDKFHLLGSIKTTLNFTKQLSFIGQVGIDYTDTNFTTKNPITKFEPETAGGRYAFGRENITLENYRGILNYNINVMDNNIHINAFAGGELNRGKMDRINVSTFGPLNFPDYWSLNNERDWPSISDKGKVRGHTYGSRVDYSAFGSATISWKDDVYLELQARNDWSSTLPPENNSYFYPGIGVSWNFTNNFKIPYMETGKLRASWADVGRAAPGDMLTYYANPSFSTGQVNNTNALTVDAPASLFAGAMKPERKREFEVGFDASFLKDRRIETSFSFYTNNIYDQIMSIDLSNPTGFSSIKINAGNVANWGYEIMIKGTPVLTKNLRWDLTATAAKLKSKVKELYPGIKQKTVTSYADITQVAEEGRPYGELRMFDYLTDPSGNKVVDNGGSYVLDTKKVVTVGNTQPDLFGGLFSDLTYKGLTLHVGIDYKYGATMFSRSNVYFKGMGITKETLEYRDEAHGGMAYYINSSGQKVAWQHNQPAPAGAQGGLVYHDGVINPGVKNVGTPENPIYQPNDIIQSAQQRNEVYINDGGVGQRPENVFKNNYIKFRELSLAYSLPKDLVHKIGAQNLTLSILARNLFYIYKSIPNIDPESALGTDSWIEDSTYPSATSLGMGLNISF
ncbi:hypothetical protein EM308_05640 [Flavobacterium gilvum]|uniref:TonB-dependent receptor plug domain-containing protein n=1 Tax=Flavobacterium gilvum TaxID=1492737 RepID=A0AAC9I9M3_9FLAO|nr:hypothetical protein EM308_05640 [Flavobacterium gilvum]